MPPIGLPKLNMGEKPPKPPKGAAADSLKAQPRATGVGTRSVGSTGALNQGATMQLFGITAQRNNHLIGNVKAGYSAGISNIRHELLGLRVGAGIGLPTPQPKAQVNNSYMDNYMKMMELQMLQKTIGDTATAGLALAKALKSDKTEKPKGKEDPDTKASVSNDNISSQLSAANTSKSLTESMKNLDKNIETINKSIEENTESIKQEKEIQKKLNTSIKDLGEKISVLEGDLRNLDIALNSGKIDQSTYTAKKQEIDTQLAELRKEKSSQETQLKNSLKCEEELVNETNEFKKEVSGKEKEKQQYSEKLEKMKSSEQSQLSKLSSALDKLKADYGKETDDSKKAKLSSDYTAKAKEFNTVLNGTVDAGSYTARGLSIDL